MATTYTDTKISQFVVNKLTQEEYAGITPDPNQLYLLPETISDTVTEDDPNPVCGGAVFNALKSKANIVNNPANGGLMKYDANNDELITVNFQYSYGNIVYLSSVTTDDYYELPLPASIAGATEITTVVQSINASHSNWIIQKWYSAGRMGVFLKLTSSTPLDISFRLITLFL